MQLPERTLPEWIRAARLGLRLENDGANWREGEFGGARLVMLRVVGGEDTAEIADVAAAVDRCIRVQHFHPLAGQGQADAIAVAGDGRQVKDHRELGQSGRCLPNK